VVGFAAVAVWQNGPIGQVLLQFGVRVIFSWPATVIAATVVAFR
jgi:molybdate transport system permease protein